MDDLTSKTRTSTEFENFKREITHLFSPNFSKARNFLNLDGACTEFLNILKITWVTQQIAGKCLL